MKQKQSKNRQLAVTRPHKYLTKIRKEHALIEEDATVEWMGRFGQSYKAIQRETGLSKYQIAKRLKDKGVKLRDYRDGTSDIGKYVTEKITWLAERRIVQHVERRLLK